MPHGFKGSGTPPAANHRGRPLGAARAATGSKARVKKACAPVAAPAPKVSKDELRVQVETLERTVAALRAHS